MRPHIRRHALVVGLILAAGLAAVATRGQDPAIPVLPPAQVLVEGSPWRVESASAPAGYGMVYRQWRLVDESGRVALLYLGVTARVQTMLRWSGERGYEGEGYVVLDRRDISMRLGNGREAQVGEATLQHLTDRRLVRYAVVGPHGTARRPLDLALGAAWDAVRGRAYPYFLVRVSTRAGDGGAAAAGLLGYILPRLDVTSADAAGGAAGRALRPAETG